MILNEDSRSAISTLSTLPLDLEAPCGPSKQPGPLTLLVVDDDRAILTVLRATFEHAGYVVVSTNDSRNVFPMLEVFKPDAVVLDLVMPGLSGWDLLAALRDEEQFRETPIILMSAASDACQRVRGLRCGADDFVVKPFHPDEILVRMEACLAGKVRDGADIEGNLEVQSIQEVVQSLENGGKTGELNIEGEGVYGHVLVRNGKFIEARCGGYLGTMAVQALLELRSGRFRFKAQEIEGGRRGCSFIPLLMQEAWVTDELEARQDYVGEPDVSLTLSGEPLRIPGQLAGLPFVEVFQYLGAHPGARLATLLEQGFDSPHRVQLVVAWAREDGLLEPSGGPSGLASSS